MVLLTGVLSVLLGAVVLIGWYTLNTKLIQVLPGFVPMQFNTALGFLFSGAGLTLIFKKKIALAKIVFGLIGFIGFLTLLEYIFHYDIGIDELLMDHYITTETSHPGRMAPNTALCFLLSSMAVFFSMAEANKKIQYGGVMGIMVFGLGLAAFLGYLIGLEATYAWGKLTKMAVHTAVGFMVIGTGLTAFGLLKEIEYKSSNTINKNVCLTGYAFALALIIFFIDLSLPLGIAIGVPYILVVLFGWFIQHRGITTLLAFCATIFIIAGYFYSAEGASTWMVLANRTFAIMSIWLVAGLLHQIKRKESALEVTNKELDGHIIQISNKNKELEQFTYIATHDLQEPLRTVISFTNLLEQQYKDKSDENVNQYFMFIKQASTQMSDLIKGLLDYSLIGQEKQMVQLDLGEIVKTIQTDFQATISATNSKLIIKPLPQIKGYKDELRMLFQNLILNAIKFRKKGFDAIVNISAIDKAGYWEFSVRDNGIGIAPKYQKKIFSIFRRLHSKKEFEGTGIGLAHCQKIVELHQGQIWVNSVPEKGSTFTFTLKKN